MDTRTTTFSWIVIALTSKRSLEAESAGSLIFTVTTRNLAMESTTHQGISSSHFVLEPLVEILHLQLSHLIK